MYRIRWRDELLVEFVFLIHENLLNLNLKHLREMICSHIIKYVALDNSTVFRKNMYIRRSHSPQFPTSCSVKINFKALYATVGCTRTSNSLCNFYPWKGTIYNIANTQVFLRVFAFQFLFYLTSNQIFLFVYPCKILTIYYYI